MENGRGRIALPQHLAQALQQPPIVDVFGVKRHDFPIAHPVPMVLDTADGKVLHIFGGFSPLEAATLQMAAAIAPLLMPMQAGEMNGWTAAVAGTSRKLAEAVLRECSRPAEPQPTEATK